MSDEGHGDLSGRLESRRERDQAERRYVAALAALDTAAELPPAVTASAAASDADHARLNQVWNKYAPAGTDRAGGMSARVKRVMAELARLLPWRRRALHGAMIAAINRQAEVTRALIDATRHFQSHVIWYGQTVAPFAATQRPGPAGAEDAEAVSAALNALAAEWMRHRDTFQVREQRFDARMAALTRAYEELREVANLAQQGTVALRRAIDARDHAPGAGDAARAAASDPAAAVSATDLDVHALDYVAFEDRFRGSQDDIRRRLTDYLPLFAGASNVLDVGCGRGEWLDLLRTQGISARGVDLNAEMVDACRARGLTADRIDAIAFLAAQPDQSLGGMIAIQVVEHLEPRSLVRLLELAHDKLAPGAPLVLETINVACWAAFFDSYLRDVTHVRPLHPDTLRYLVQANGFPDAQIQYRSPIEAHDQLPAVRLPKAWRAAEADPVLLDMAAALNAHAERLNAQLFSHRDYAVIARR